MPESQAQWPRTFYDDGNSIIAYPVEALPEWPSDGSHPEYFLRHYPSSEHIIPSPLSVTEQNVSAREAPSYITGWKLVLLLLGFVDLHQSQVI